MTVNESLGSTPNPGKIQLGLQKSETYNMQIKNAITITEAARKERTPNIRDLYKSNIERQAQPVPQNID